MQVGLRRFHASSISGLISEVDRAGVTRQSLARALCAREDWQNCKGENCVSSAAGALPVLASKLDIRLPAALSAPLSSAGGSRRRPSTGFPNIFVRCGLRACGEISLVPVVDDDDLRLWESMVETHHPLGWSRAPGGQMRYWVRSSRYGILGGIGFSASDWKQRPRDEFIGWSADELAADLRFLVCNHRFLILPGVRATPSLRRRLIAAPILFVARFPILLSLDTGLLNFIFSGPS